MNTTTTYTLVGSTWASRHGPLWTVMAVRGEEIYVSTTDGHPCRWLPSYCLSGMTRLEGGAA